ncbi:MAG: hypothetical protein DME44_12200, partial [Verrucomicrobia bacterium]
MGSAGVSRVGFGVTPKQAFQASGLNGLIGRREKFAKAEHFRQQATHARPSITENARFALIIGSS